MLSPKAQGLGDRIEWDLPRGEEFGAWSGRQRSGLAVGGWGWDTDGGDVSTCPEERGPGSGKGHWRMKQGERRKKASSVKVLRTVKRKT